MYDLDHLRIELLMEYTEESFVLVDQNMNIVTCNKKFRDQYRKYFRREVQNGESILSYVQPGREDLVKNIYLDVLNGNSHETEINVPEVDGSVTYYQIRYKPFRNAQGEILGTFVSTIDVTQQKNAQALFQKNEKRYRALVENAGEAIAILSPDGKPLYASPSVPHVLGYSVEEAMQIDLFSMIHPDDVNDVIASVQQAVEQPGVSVIGSTSRVKHKDGSWRWIEATITNLIHDPEIGGIVDNFRDVTYKIEFARQMELERNTLRAIIDNIPDYIFVKDTDSRYVVSNKKLYQDLFGLQSESETIGKSDIELFGNELAGTYIDDDQKVLKSGEPIIDLQEYAIGKDGIRHRVSTSKIPIRDANGNVVGLIGISRNITKAYYHELEEKTGSDIFIALNSSENLSEALTEVLELIAELTETQVAEAWMVARDAPKLFRKAIWIEDESYRPFVESGVYTFKRGNGLPGLVWDSRELTILHDIAHNPAFLRSDIVEQVGLETAYGVPILVNNELVAVVALFSKTLSVDRFQKIDILKKISPVIGLGIKRRQSVDDLNSYFTMSPNMLGLSGTDGYFLKINPAFTRILGYSEKELLERPFVDYLHPDDFEITRLEYEKNKNEGVGADAFVNRYISKSGEIKWISWHSSQLKDEAGIFFTYGSDVTRLKTSEEELRIANTRYDIVAKATNDAVWDWNLVTNQLYWGEGYYEHFGFEYHDKPDINNWMNHIHPDDVEKVMEEIMSVVNSENESVYEGFYRYIKNDGTIAQVYDRGYVVRDDKGTPIRMIGAMRDITMLKQNESRLRDLNRQLEQRADELAATNAELEQFAYIASHDLQEPLRMVTSFLKLLESRYQDQLDDVAKQYIEFATDGAVRMRQLILDLLQYSRVGRDDFDRIDIDMNELISDVLSLNANMINDSDAEITWGSLPIIKAARTPIIQLFQNLIHNAIKYRRTDVAPKIQVEAIETPTHWQFSISDNGIGIDSRYFDKIFVIFQRLHGRDEYTGTGIGLAICKKIVDTHYGKIWVESVVGEGSTFYFTIAKLLPNASNNG
jgi:PAS domain S-box-containing protein